MNFNNHSNLEGQHAFLGASKYHWINYGEDKVAEAYRNFLATQKTIEETIDYIRCMTLTQNVDPLVYQCITNSHIDAVNAYIEEPMTASTVKEEKGGPINRQQITSELIYYWMIAYHIPFECQKWHLNRLLMLIRICNAENKPPKKRSKRDLYRHHAEVNAANRKKFNSKG